MNVEDMQVQVMGIFTADVVEAESVSRFGDYYVGVFNVTKLARVDSIFCQKTNYQVVASFDINSSYKRHMIVSESDRVLYEFPLEA